jgi:ribonuclease BN (tRNA processing enzyme)
MIISQVLASGGIWLSLGGTEILLDPGPGCVVQTAKRKLQGGKLSAIIISHRHLDHTGDLNVMVEAMTQGGLRPHGVVFAPGDAWGPEPVMFSYLKKTVDQTVVLEEGKSYQVGDVTFETPVRHIHPVETYGMVFKTRQHTFSYIADSRFFPGLMQHYRGDLLIINTVFLEPHVPGYQSILPVEHLSIPDARQIIAALKPKVAILTHFGVSVWRAHPWEIAEQVSQETGVRVIAARDGMKFDLATLADGDAES